jgi:hypothetical protein
MRSYPVKAKFEHVRRHQDTKIPFSELPLLANLNVEADKYAGSHRAQHGHHRPLIPLSATRPVALDLQGRTIHCGFKQAIWDSLHAPHLLEAMQVRYDWPNGTLCADTAKVSLLTAPCVRRLMKTLLMSFDVLSPPGKSGVST